ncbi:MAG: endonuclease/exonuclease/phosphatase family protein [Bacteroidales bacterium]|nr:endonuclease/exonuclease/phosphatase family protein [Bacteroidales bacterium]
MLLLFAYLSYYVNPSDVSYLAFAGIAYPYILLANLIFVIYWVIFRFKFALVPLFFILIGWNHIERLYQFSGSDDEALSPDSFSVMSYNMQNFLKINTASTKYITDFTNQENIISFLQNNKTDIYCLQEMLNDRLDEADFLKEMGNLLGCPYYHYKNYYIRKTKTIDAIAIFSKYRIISSGDIQYDKKSIAIYADVIKNTDTIRIYNLHLASIHFKQEDIDFWKEIQNNQEKYDQEALKSGSLKLFGKMNAAYIKRGFQVDLITEHMDESPHPIILCGDFNDTPLSYTYRKLANSLQDTFVEAGKGFGSTYAGEHLPNYRIDFILCDPEFKVERYTRHEVSFSDHFPISCSIY